MAKTDQHPPLEQLRAYSLGQLNDSMSRHIERHLMNCPDCKDALFEIPATDEFIDWLQRVHKERSPIPGVNAESLAPGVSANASTGLADSSDSNT